MVSNAFCDIRRSNFEIIQFFVKLNDSFSVQTSLRIFVDRLGSISDRDFGWKNAPKSYDNQIRRTPCERNVSDNRIRPIESAGRNTVRKPDPANRMAEGSTRVPKALRVDVSYSWDLKRKCKTTKPHRFVVNAFIQINSNMVNVFTTQNLTFGGVIFRPSDIAP